MREELVLISSELCSTLEEFDCECGLYRCYWSRNKSIKKNKVCAKFIMELINHRPVFFLSSYVHHWFCESAK